MIELGITRKDIVYEQLKRALSRHICGAIKILKTDGGKPYLEGEPPFFSVAHSGKTGVFAISDRPVGVDLELLKPEKNIAAVARKLNLNGVCYGDFLRVWTALEAFTKMKGSSIITEINGFELRGGEIYKYGIRQDCKIFFPTVKGGVACVCAEGYERADESVEIIAM